MLDTYEKVIEYLKMYKKLQYDIEFYRNKMQGLKAISYSNEEKGTSMNNMMSVYMQKIDDAQSRQNDIEKFIEDNFNGIDRLIIYEKFICDKSLNAIANDVGYSNMHVKRMMNKAIYRYLAS